MKRAVKSRKTDSDRVFFLQTITAEGLTRLFSNKFSTDLNGFQKDCRLQCAVLVDTMKSGSKGSTMNFDLRLQV